MRDGFLDPQVGNTYLYLKMAIQDILIQIVSHKHEHYIHLCYNIYWPKYILSLSHIEIKE
jgi:hypothetical protein